ncbi:serine-threonine protein kinase [Streptomyces nigrescens]|uniref:serine-threonine protein kinase n=1 Tax=Streptomyces nigrescens TaxID=1920 RepID=UPI00224D0615|nr:serine-threonine protein kinase [Streptomyces libani]MCX5450808.1 serine-threonine protein kinase [Streptomyces libani]
MKEPVKDIRYWEIKFSKEGTLLDDSGLAEEICPAGDGRGESTDLLVFSHGWNASEESARGLYREMFSLMADILPPERRESVGFVGIFWPSLLFPEDEPAADGPPVNTASAAQRLDIRGATSPTRHHSSGTDIATALKPAFVGQEKTLDEIARLLDSRPQDPNQLSQFHELVKRLVTTSNDAAEDTGEETIITRGTRDVLNAMADLAPTADDDAQAFDPFAKLWSGARELLRTASYYEMKNRAGAAGKNGLGPLLAKIATAAPSVRINLIGHSFGARLVSYALTALPAGVNGTGSPVKSLLLIQGAFSHFAFAPKAPVMTRSGALSAVADRVDGPLLSTFTSADRAVGWWYPNASRLARQDNEALEHLNYRWGAMGHDGFQQQQNVTTLALKETHYDFEPGSFYRLDANDVIKRRLSWFAMAHSDIRHREVACAALAAARLI